MPAYTVRVSREGKWWFIRVPDIDNAITQARRLSEVEAMARDLIAAMSDVDPASFGLNIELDAVEDLRVSEIKDATESTREELEAAQAQFQARLRTDARKLARGGLAVRDIGYILGVSYQRVHQLLDEASRRG